MIDRERIPMPLLEPARWRVAIALTLLILAVLVAGAARAGERLALVIGNSNYAHLNDLPNAANDAPAVAERLAGLGFTLVGPRGRDAEGALLDLDDNGFFTAMRDFTERAAGAEIALVYYAGHGMQIEGQPYLLPTNVPGDDLDLLRRKALGLEDLLARLDGRAELTVAVFDACREIPELDAAVTRATRASGYGPAAYRGLSRVQSPGRSRIVAYSGAAGQLVADGKGDHSPYTEILLAHLDRPEPVNELFQRVAWQFGERHGGQHPEVLIQGVQPGRFWLVPPRVVPGPVPPPPAMLGHLQVSVDAPGARVRVNGREMGVAAPGAELNLSNLPTGPVRVEVSAPGREAVSRDAEIRVGAWTQLVFGLPSSGPKPGDNWTEPRTGMELVWVPGGTFTLGCGGAWAGDCYDDERPARQVTLGGFWMGRHEVTQAQWRAVMGSNPSNFAGCDDCPVERVSWHDARAFISELDPAGRLGLGLPTEAQWEYACRGGGREETYCGGDDPDRLAWYSANSGRQTHPVGRKAANALGLHDMSGNVWEWTCSASSDAYGGQESRCVGGDDVGSGRSLRGGSWVSYPRNVRAADRNRFQPEARNDNLGFRLARTITP